jgi:hypothetical protein
MHGGNMPNILDPLTEGFGTVLKSQEMMVSINYTSARRLGPRLATEKIPLFFTVW